MDARVTITVGISDCKISSDPADVIVTYSLGSCIGLVLYDPEARVGGMVHCMLPLSKIDPNKARLKPAMFMDTGVPFLLEGLLRKGAQKKRLIAKAAGAARLLDDQNTFRIGERNHTVLRKLLWKNNILIAAEDVGGSIARTMYLHMGDGRVCIRSGGKERELV